MDRDQFFHHLWQDLTRIAPQAEIIRRALADAGETVRNDHVAFRTFDRSPVNLNCLERHILGFGYAPIADYSFPQKHLRARAYVCAGAPRLFLSELLVDALSPQAVQIIDACLSQVEPRRFEHPPCFYSGIPWSPISLADYHRLAEETEYGAWMLALGYHANHFTVSVNHLRTLTSIEAVLQFVERLGFAVNAAGGRVKGSPQLLLEQGSTLADRQEVEFADGRCEIPTCYTEFALRHPDEHGVLYEGFVTDSADRIFESTHSKHASASVG